MANTQYIKPNRSMSEIEEQQIKRQKRKIKYAFGVALLALIVGELYVDVYVGAVVAVLLFFLITRDTKNIAEKQLESDAQGQQDALEVLDKLTDDYVIFNQLNIPAKYIADDERECDCIVVSNDAVYVIDVYNQRGLVTVKADHSEWEVVKKLKGNQSQSLQIKNPIFKVKQKQLGLQQWLASKGIVTQVIPIVFFVHKEVAVNGVQQAELSIVTRENILKQFSPKANQIDQKAVVKLLQ